MPSGRINRAVNGSAQAGEAVEDDGDAGEELLAVVVLPDPADDGVHERVVLGIEFLPRGRGRVEELRAIRIGVDP